MQIIGADRRFMVLLACALAATVALGIATDRGPESARAGAAARQTTPDALSLRTDAGAGPRLPEAAQPELVLMPLLTVYRPERLPKPPANLAPAPPILTGKQVVSYYGNPHTAQMGVLGAGDLETVATLLEAQAARYDRLNGPTEVVPALHLVYAVAQPHPTENGLYLQYLDDETVRRFLTLTEERGMLLFLDLQIGRSSVETELSKVLPYLRHPNVHLAIDPEFAVGASEVPGNVLGSVGAADIDRAQATLQELVEAESLPPKLLIVHQFIDSMVLDSDAIQTYPDVELVIDMDGYGDANIKRVKYERYAARSYAARAAIKLFFDYDPDLMSEADVLSMEPRPSVIIYQ